MKIKEVKEQPTKGQFVGMWIHNGEVWSSTYRFNELGYLEHYSDEEDDFTTGVGFPKAEIRWFVME